MIRVALALLLLTGCASQASTHEPRPTTTQAPVGLGEITVENGTNSVIFRVRFSAATDVEWGPDQLGNEILKPGASRAWYLPTGRYAVQVQLKDGAVVTAANAYRVGPGRPQACTIERPASEVGTLTLRNETGFAIARVYFTLTSKLAWGEDRLSTVLAPNARSSWKLAPGRYNLKVEFQDGTTRQGKGSYEVAASEESVYTLR